MSKEMSRSMDTKFLRIRILSNGGDKINLKFPIEFVKRLLKLNGFSWLNIQNEIIDQSQVTNMILQALDSNIRGEVANIERKNGDSVRIIID